MAAMSSENLERVISKVNLVEKTAEQILDENHIKNEEFLKTSIATLKRRVKEEPASFRTGRLPLKRVKVLAEVLPSNIPSTAAATITSAHEDLSLLSYNQLRAKCKELGIPAKGKRDFLEQKILEQLAVTPPPQVPHVPVETANVIAEVFASETEKTADQEKAEIEKREAQEKKRQQEAAEEAEKERKRQQEAADAAEAERKKEELRLEELNRMMRKDLPSVSDLKKKLFPTKAGGGGGGGSSLIKSPSAKPSRSFLDSSSFLLNPKPSFNNTTSNSANNSFSSIFGVPPGRVHNSDNTPLSPPPAPVVPPREEYVITSDEDDPDEDDNGSDEENSKNIPAWARGEELKKALQFQYEHFRDTDVLFPENKNPAEFPLDEIFKKKAGFRPRSSSSNWTQDVVTVDDILKHRDGIKPPSGKF